MLRHDSESSRRLLYSGTVKTWFKAILENQKIPSWLCRLLFFSKIAAGGPTKPWNLCLLFQKILRRANYIRYHTRSYIPYHIIHTIPYIHIYHRRYRNRNCLHFWPRKFQKFPPEAQLNHETYVLFSKIPAGGPTKPWNLSFI